MSAQTLADSAQLSVCVLMARLYLKRTLRGFEAADEPSQETARRPHNFKDISGEVFGFLTVVKYYGGDRYGAVWECVCECGARKMVHGAVLRLGSVRSCGCKRGQLISLAVTRHGYARGGKVAREHAIWRGMITRCTNAKRKGFADYGGRGIEVCARWLQFENFITDMGAAPAGYSIDRIDNDRGYEPGNCRWADAKTQARNRRPRKRAR